MMPNAYARAHAGSDAQAMPMHGCLRNARTDGRTDVEANSITVINLPLRTAHAHTAIIVNPARLRRPADPPPAPSTTLSTTQRSQP